MKKTKLIKISKEFYNFLNDAGTKAETYEDIILRLIRWNNPWLYRRWKKYNGKP